MLGGIQFLSICIIIITKFRICIKAIEASFHHVIPRILQYSLQGGGLGQVRDTKSSGRAGDTLSILITLSGEHTSQE